MAEKVDFLNLMTGVVDKNKNDFWFDDKQFKFIPHKLLVPPYNVNLSLVYPGDEPDDLPFVKKNDDYTIDDSENLDDSIESFDDLDANDDDLNEDDDYLIDSISNENDDRLSVREVTVRFAHGSIIDSIMNSNMDNETKWKTIRMLNTAEAHIVKPDNLSAEASMRWDNWAYNLEKLNSHTNGYTVLKNFEGHLYPSRNGLNSYNNVELRIIDRPDVEFLPFND